jgi:hypothetical protein
MFINQEYLQLLSTVTFGLQLHNPSIHLLGNGTSVSYPQAFSFTYRCDVPIAACYSPYMQQDSNEVFALSLWVEENAGSITFMINLT